MGPEDEAMDTEPTERSPLRGLLAVVCLFAGHAPPKLTAEPPRRCLRCGHRVQMDGRGKWIMSWTR